MMHPQAPQRLAAWGLREKAEARSERQAEALQFHSD